MFKGVKNAAIILGISLLIILSGEALLRVWFPDESTSAGRAKPNSDLAFVPHPVYLVALKPNLADRSFRRVTQNGDVVTHWGTNSASFRGPELGTKQGLRIIVYGDSNIFARFSNYEDTFPYQLQEELRRKVQPDVEVINAGTPGFGPDQSVLRFEQEVDVYKPDILVFHVFADNDFGDIIRNQLFELDSSGALLKTAYERPVDPCLVQNPCDTGKNEKYGVGQTLTSLKTVKAIRKVLTKIGLLPAQTGPTAEATLQFYIEMTEQEYATYKNVKAGTLSHFVDHYDYDLALYPDRESSQVKVQLMRRILEKACQVAESKHVQLMVFVQPSSRDLTTNLEPNFGHFSRFPGYARTNLSEVVMKAAQVSDIAALNLFDVFFRNAPEHLYFTGNDDHWNASGQKLAAQEVATFIRERFLVSHEANALVR